MPSPYPQERRGRLVPRGRHASDVARVAPYGRDTRQERGHRPAGHRHLRRQGAGPPLRREALRGARRCAARMGTQTTQAHLHEIESVERLTLYSLLAEASARC